MVPGHSRQGNGPPTDGILGEKHFKRHAYKPSEDIKLQGQQINYRRDMKVKDQRKIADILLQYVLKNISVLNRNEQQANEEGKLKYSNITK